MFLVILLYDQLLFRPLSYWAEKFKIEAVGYERVYRPWVIKLLQRTRLLKRLDRFFALLGDRFVNFTSFRRHPILFSESNVTVFNKVLVCIGYALLSIGFMVGTIFFVRFIIQYIHASEIFHVIF